MLFVNAGRMDYARGVVDLFASEAGDVSSVQEAEVCSMTQEPSIIGRCNNFCTILCSLA